MRSSTTANQWHYWMTVHFGAASKSGLVHPVRGMVAHGSDVADD